MSNSTANLWVAASDGNLTRVRELIESGQYTADQQDDNGYSALAAAASWGHPDVLRYLVEEKGVRIDDVTDPDGDTCLFVVESVAMAQLVISLGGSPSFRNLSGLTAADVLTEDAPDVARYLRVVSAASSSSAAIAELDAAPTTFATEEELDETTETLLGRVREVMLSQERGDLSAQEVETKLREIVELAVLGTVETGRRIGAEEAEVDANGDAVGSSSRSRDDADDGDGGRKRSRPNGAEEQAGR